MTSNYGHYVVCQQVGPQRSGDDLYLAAYTAESESQAIGFFYEEFPNRCVPGVYAEHEDEAYA